MNVEQLIIAGASITNSPWFTWADHAEQYLKPNNVVDLSIKGCGNKFIAMSVINFLANNEVRPNTQVMAMFTCVDKLDLYVDAEQAHNLKSQKHPPINLQARYCGNNESGFWSTGSHFPEIKSYYKENYFNIDWLVTDTILTIHNLVELCKTLKVELVCLFDGDIWNYTESDYNQIVLGYNISPKNFLQGELASKFQSLLPVELHQTKSLIEYARERNLPIYNPTCKLHPPSNVHLNWFRDTILPKIKFQTYSLQQSYLDKVDSFSKEWNNQK